MSIDHMSPEARAEIDMKFDQLIITLTDEQKQKWDTSPEMVLGVMTKINAEEPVTAEEREAIGRFADALNEGVDKNTNPYDSGIIKTKANLTLARLVYESGDLIEAEKRVRSANFEIAELRDSYERDELEKDKPEGEEIFEYKWLDKLQAVVTGTNELGKILWDQLSPEEQARSSEEDEEY